MNDAHEHIDEEFVDLGSVTAETHGLGTADESDVPLRRQQIGIIAE